MLSTQPYKTEPRPCSSPASSQKTKFLECNPSFKLLFAKLLCSVFVGFAGRNQGVLSDFYLLRGFLVNCIVILLSQFYFAFQLWLILSYNKHTIYFSKKGIHPCYFNNCIFNSNSSFVDCLVYFIAFFILPALLSSKIFSSKS